MYRKFSWIGITAIYFSLFLWVIFIFHSTQALAAASVTLVWQANPSGTPPSGYKFYYGTKSRSYNKILDVGNNTSCTLSNLTPGTYYGAVRAYNDFGESPFSPEVEFTVSDTRETPSYFFIETGEIQINHQWKKVYINGSFTDPVVVASGMSYNGHDPAIIRIQNIKKDSFEIRVQEWDYLDQVHPYETAGYIVMERGEYILPNGTMVKADRFNTHNTGSFLHIDFGTQFNETPVLVTAITSYNGGDTVGSRVKDVTKYGFRFCMQEQEANKQSHVTEEISYIAWEPSSGTLGTLEYETGFAESSLGSALEWIPFSLSFSGSPSILVSMQTSNGMDTASLRWCDADMNGFNVKVEEEQSKDSETYHVREKIGYMVFFLNK